MPLYCFKCEKCDTRAEIFTKKIDGGYTIPLCPDCDYDMVRDWQAENGNDYGRDYFCEGGQSLLSDAMGVHPNQVQEHRKAYPNIPLTDDGRVVCRNAVERKRIMKELGFVDRDGY